MKNLPSSAKNAMMTKCIKYHAPYIGKVIKLKP